MNIGQSCLEQTRNVMNKLKIAAAVVLTLASAASFAQSKNTAGFYGLANFGFTSSKGTGSGIDVYGNDYQATNKGAGNSWALGLGYDIDETFAVEAQYGSVWKQEDSNQYTNQWGNNENSSKTNVMALSLTGLAKYQISENTKLFAGPTVSFLRLKNSNSQTYRDQNGAISYEDSNSSSMSKTLPGIVVGSFALDQKTDLRVSYTKFKTWTMGNPGQQEDNKISNLSFGLTIKF